MSVMEAYSYLFFNSLLSGLIFPLQSDMVFIAMSIFKNYPMVIVTLIALAGKSGAILFNWWLGMMGMYIQKVKNPVDTSKAFMHIITFFKRYGRWLLLAGAFMPVLGGFLVAIAGLTRMKITTTVGYAMMSYFLYMLYILYM